MNIQTILVFVLFLLALSYVGRMVYRAIASKKGCASNCNKCSVDFSDVKPVEE